MSFNRFFHFFPRFFCTMVLGVFLLNSCSSYQQYQNVAEEFEIPSKVFKADFNQTWQAVLQYMKKYDLALTSQDAGVIKTRWIDNTIEMNFIDSFGTSDSVKAAKFKIVVNVVKGFKGDREVSKVTVFKRQMVEQDFMQGWKVLATDGILEQTILYRIQRIIDIDNQLKSIEEKKAKEQEAKL